MIIRFSTYIIFASLRSQRSLSGEAIFSSDLQPTASSGKVLPAYRLLAACLPAKAGSQYQIHYYYVVS